MRKKTTSCFNGLGAQLFIEWKNGTGTPAYFMGKSMGFLQLFPLNQLIEWLNSRKKMQQFPEQILNIPIISYGCALCPNIGYTPKWDLI